MAVPVIAGAPAGALESEVIASQTAQVSLQEQNVNQILKRHEAERQLESAKPTEAELEEMLMDTWCCLLPSHPA